MRQIKDNISLASLIAKYTRGALSEKESMELEKWIASSESNNALFNKLTGNTLSNIKHRKTILESANKEMVWNKIESSLRKKKRTRIISVLQVAASILLIVGAFTLVLINKNPYSIMEKTSGKVVISKNLSPTLITSDGKAFSLDKKIKLSHQNVSILNNNKKLVYEKSTQAVKPVKATYNTIIVPKGADYKLQLADGTEVWLNSDTKLKYPSSFQGKNRKVYLEGEAFFDVTKDKSHPFIVNVNDVNVKVLGTSFNVNGYKDASEITTTLVEGKVKVESNVSKSSRIILPNEQLVFNTKSGDYIKQKVDTRLYTAWRNGRFVFCEESLEDIMRRLSRIYDIEVFYMHKEVKNLKFSGDLSRYKDIEKIFEMLEVTKKVKFSKKNNTVIIESL